MGILCIIGLSGDNGYLVFIGLSGHNGYLVYYRFIRR